MKKTILNVVVAMSMKFLQVTIINCLLLSTIYASTSNAQYVRSVRNQKIDIELNKISLVQALNKIESVTNYTFAYQNEDISNSVRVSGKFKKKSVAEILTEISKQSKLKFKQVNNTIHISKKDGSSSMRVEIAMVEVDISGKITDENSVGLPGASVVVKGTANGTTTDLDGNYKLSVPEESTVVISFVGYKTTEIVVGSQTVIDLQMLPDAEQLEEVVVTAFNIKREKKSLSYATQGLDAEDMKEARSANFVQSLSGAVAGVSVMNSQTPSGSNRVVIRGVSSVTGNNQPLYVIDGIPLDNTSGDDDVSVWNGGGDIDYGDPLSQINPDDIESVEVLKGANGSALYGSRAANGVILITTKKGKSKSSEWGITINSNTMFNKVSEYPDYQYVYGSGSTMGKAAHNANHLDRDTGYPLAGRHTRAYGGPMLGQPIIAHNGEVSSYLPQYDNIREMYKTGANITNTVTLEKSTDKGSFRLSYANTMASWVMKNQEERQRHNLTLRTSMNLTDKLTVDANILYTYDQIDNRVYQNGSNRNPANNYMYMHPNMAEENLTPYADEAGIAFNFRGPFHNPLWNIYENGNEDLTNRLISSVGLNYEIIDGLSVRFKGMTDVRIQSGSEFNNYGGSYDVDGLYRAFNTEIYNFNYEGMVNYSKTWDKLSLNAYVGGNIYKYSNTQRRSTISSLLLPDVQSLANSAGTPIVSESDRRKQIESVFASASLGYNGIVFLDLTGRNDKSSTLPKGSNSFSYFSAGTSFIFTELLPKSNILSFGKLRASWGQAGSDADPYRIMDAYGYSGNYNGLATVGLGQTKNNQALKNELTENIEVGLEANFMEGRFSLNATYYKSSSTNQILSAQVSPATGFNQQIFNAGEIQNKGVELYLNTKILENDFKWNVDVNWAKNESLVVSLLDGVDRFGMRQWFNVQVYAEVGQPFGVLRGKVSATDEEGNPLVGNNGRILGVQDQIMGHAQPDWIGGVRNSFKYKGFNVNFLIDFRSGGDVYSASTLKNTNFGMHAITMGGRDEYLFSDTVLGESGNERRGQGLYGNDYADEERVKGNLYENAYIGTTDPDTGEIVPLMVENPETGQMEKVPSRNFINQTYYYDIINSQERITYNTSYVKLRELVIGYTFNNKLLDKTPFRTARVSFVARNLWTIHRNTPRGIDPEASTTSGNGQGIEYGSFLPMRSYGFNLNFSF
ncbi:MAG: SusC/RagA family TonB-linked outer membrane protein [Cyclobacteriaceae bacterium]